MSLGGGRHQDTSSKCTGLGERMRSPGLNMSRSEAGPINIVCHWGWDGVMVTFKGSLSSVALHHKPRT
jgi:hypothetical protein